MLGYQQIMQSSLPTEWWWGVGKPTPLCDASHAKLFWPWREKHDLMWWSSGLTLGHYWLWLVLRPDQTRPSQVRLSCVVGLNAGRACFVGCKLRTFVRLWTPPLVEGSWDHLPQQVLVWFGSYWTLKPVDLKPEPEVILLLSTNHLWVDC